MIIGNAFNVERGNETNQFLKVETMNNERNDNDNETFDQLLSKLFDPNTPTTERRGATNMRRNVADNDNENENDIMRAFALEMLSPCKIDALVFETLQQVIATFKHIDDTIPGADIMNELRATDIIIKACEVIPVGIMSSPNFRRGVGRVMTTPLMLKRVDIEIAKQRGA